MNHYCSIICLLLVFACGNVKEKSAPTHPVNEKELSTDSIETSSKIQTIAFGSCNKSDMPQTIWNYVIKNQPDLWVWLGDNVYADTEDMDMMKGMYQQQKQNEEYQKLVSTTPIIGIWDDHDYGINDGDKNYKKKKESKQLLLDFLDVPADALVRKREGAYQSYVYGEGNQRVKVILLDTRYFRDELTPNPSGNPRYFPNPDGDILGDAQWQWLEKELRANDAEVHLICSSIQVLHQEHAYEKWENFPKARKRLLTLIETSKVNHPILFSGDRHIGEVAKMELANGQEIIEITTSGLTHSYEKAKEKNKYRIGDLVPLKNFAVLNIDWNTHPLKFKVDLKGPGNQVYLSHSF